MDQIICILKDQIRCAYPGLEGAVVVATHKHEVSVGQVLKLSLPSD
ncbi:CRISPR-associated protein Csx3 [Microcoleus sp. S13_C5]